MNINNNINTDNIIISSIILNGFKELTSTTANNLSSDNNDKIIATKKYVDEHTGGFDFDNIDEIKLFYTINYDTNKLYKALINVSNSYFTIDNISQGNIIKDKIYKYTGTNYNFNSLNFYYFLFNELKSYNYYYTINNNITNNDYNIYESEDVYSHTFTQNYLYEYVYDYDKEIYYFNKFEYVNINNTSDFILSSLVENTIYKFNIDLTNNLCVINNHTYFNKNYYYKFNYYNEYQNVYIFELINYINFDFVKFENNNYYISYDNQTNDNYTINNNSHYFIKNNIYKYVNNNNFSDESNNIIDYDFSFNFQNNKKYLAGNSLTLSNKTFTKNYIYECSTYNFPYDGFTEIIPQNKDMIKINDKILIYLTNKWYCLDIGNIDITNIYNNNNSEIFNDNINNKALGLYSSTLGYNNISSSDYCTTIGKYNKDEKDSLFIVGNGKEENNIITRNNAFEIKNNGNIKCNDIIYNDNIFLNNKCLEIEDVKCFTSKTFDENHYYYSITDCETSHFLSDNTQFNQYYIYSYNSSTNLFSYYASFPYDFDVKISSFNENNVYRPKYDIYTSELIEFKNYTITIYNSDGETVLNNFEKNKYYYCQSITETTITFKYMNIIYVDFTFKYELNKLYLAQYEVNNTNYTPSNISKYQIYKCINNSFDNITFEKINIDNLTIIFIKSRKTIFIYYNNIWNPINVGNYNFNNFFDFDDNYNRNGEIFNSNDNNAFGIFSHSEGDSNTSYGDYSHSEGYNNSAYGNASHVEGNYTQAIGYCAHAEGDTTKASGDRTHAEGSDTVASGYGAHAEGITTKSTEYASHSEGNETQATGESSHSEGIGDKWNDLGISSGEASHTEGKYCNASAVSSHAEGMHTVASGYYSHSGGCLTVADKPFMTVIGGPNIYDSSQPTLNNNKLFVVGNGTINNIDTNPSVLTRSDAFVVKDTGDIFAQNNLNCNNIIYNDSNYKNIKVFEIYNFYWFDNEITTSDISKFENNKLYYSIDNNIIKVCNISTTFKKNYIYKAIINNNIISFQENQLELNCIIKCSFNNSYFFYHDINQDIFSIDDAIDYSNNSSTKSFICHREGMNTKATGDYSHAEGLRTNASGKYSHAEGSNTTASGEYSHAEGSNTIASGKYSHAGGIGSVADRDYQFVCGAYNTTNNNNALFCVGNGTSSLRSNAFVVNNYGDAYIKQDLYLNNKNIKKIINDLCYPINSYFLYKNKITLDNNGKPSSITNTPLDYGSWSDISSSSYYQVLGIMQSGTSYTTAMNYGNTLINLSHIPDHAHRGIMTYDGKKYSGSGSAAVPADDPSSTATPRTNNSCSTTNTVGTAHSTYFTNRGTQQVFNPYGYYLYVYLKISLD